MKTIILIILIATAVSFLAMTVLAKLGYNNKTWASKLRFILVAVAVATFVASICSIFGLAITIILAIILGFTGGAFLSEFIKEEPKETPKFLKELEANKKLDF